MAIAPLSRFEGKWMQVTSAQPDRCHVNANDPSSIKLWTKHLGVDKETLLRAIEKVGTHIPTIRKELGVEE